MKSAGVDVAGCKVNPHDGTVTIITGKPGEATTPDITDTDDTTNIDPKWN